MKKNPYSACPHDFTTGKWRVHLVYPGEPRADGFPRGSKKENPPCADTMVEFYDTEDNGQFVASFHMNTLLGYPWNGMVGADLDGLEAYGFAYPLSTQAATDWLEGDDLVICEDGIYAIADWKFNQNVPAIDAMREGNRVRKASERACKNGKGTRQVKKDKVLAYLTEHPEATNTEVAEKTGVSRPSVIKYRKEYAPALPAPKGGKIVKDDGTKVDTVKIDGVKVDSFDSKVDVNFDVKVDSDFDTGFYTDADGKSAGRQSAQGENEAVKIASHPKNIDDRYKNTATSTAVADGDGMTGSGIPTREEVRSHFAEMGVAVDPDRFFDVNEGRGWRTNSGKPVDDWKKLAAVWDRNEHPKAATPPARTEPKANAVGKIPSVEEVMAKWGCDRETAQGYIDENMY